MIRRHPIEEDKLRGLAVGQRWEGGEQHRVITGMVAVHDKSEPWLLITYLRETGKVQESSSIEFRKWQEIKKAVNTNKKGKP